MFEGPKLCELIMIRSGNFDERTKNIKDDCFEKKRKRVFCLKPESVILHDRNWDGKKLDHILVVLSE